MFERTVSYDAYFLPGPRELDPDEALRTGLKWLLGQPGEPLVVLSRKGNLSNNRILEQTVKRHKIKVAAPPRIHQPRWTGGSVLVVWAGERALLDVDSHLANQTNAVCVIGWDDGVHDTWIAGHAARDLRNPQIQLSPPVIDRVVAVAMKHAGDAINHNNALVTDSEKAMVVLTLKELVRGGYTYDVDQLAAWAIGQGWYPAEIPRLREYASKVLEGRSFRLRDAWGPSNGTVKQWEAEAASQAD
ncbi:hypothetical protein [Nocardioides alkalitolerans]|uniref:hypothetical protein n=1 Tax=Nocardioides alkalitolerans TaxID=281714 RepID=UPI00048EA01E|nr:hypothetical protein [Nocardioides alkalitolerans]